MTAPVLLTGFEPFREHRVNSSWEAVRLVAEEFPDAVRAARLPVDHASARERLGSLLDELRPRVCLACGLAVGEDVRLEVVARRPEEFADVGGPEELEGVWPWEETEARLRSEGFRVRLSRDAGRFVCESAYWTLLEHRLRSGTPHLAAFLHVPPLSSRFPAVRLARAVRGALEDAVGGFAAGGRSAP